MSLVEIVESAINEQMDRLAARIEGELKAECPKKSGTAAGAIGIQDLGAHAKRIGGTHEHLFYADQGNNQHLSYFGGKNNRRMPNYTGSGSRMLFYDGEMHVASRTYKGSHFVRKVADRHR